MPTKVNLRVRANHNFLVNFSDIEEGEWFQLQGGKVGIKVDGYGFYPGRLTGQQFRGSRTAVQNVYRIKTINITTPHRRAT